MTSLSLRSIFAAVLLAPACLHAQTEPGPSERVRAAMSRALRETLNSPLFRTQERGGLSVWVEPHFSDVTRRDSIRLPLRFEYGLTDYIELRSALHPFIDNPLKDEGDEGFTHLSVGFKNQWRHFGQPAFPIATGIDYEEPLDVPRMELHDHRAHFMPFITVSHELTVKGRPIELFSSLRLDLSPDGSRPAPEPGEPPLLHDYTRLTLGALYRATDALTWTFETIWERNIDSEDRRENLFLAPGAIWDIPRRRTGLLPGRWQLGLGLRFGLIDAEDSVRLQTRIRWTRR